VLATSEVIPSRAVRALEGEGRGLSHLEVAARGRLWRQLASRGIDRGAQRVKTNHSALILSLCSSCNYRPRCCQSWTPIPTPIQATPHSTQSSSGLVKSLPFPTLYRYALDTLSYPAMSNECERVFSSAKSSSYQRGMLLSEDRKKDPIQQQE
jgi:hypothetical protein